MNRWAAMRARLHCTRSERSMVASPSGPAGRLWRGALLAPDGAGTPSAVSE